MVLDKIMENKIKKNLCFYGLCCYGFINNFENSFYRSRAFIGANWGKDFSLFFIFLFYFYAFRRFLGIQTVCISVYIFTKYLCFWWKTCGYCAGSVTWFCGIVNWFGNVDWTWRLTLFFFSGWNQGAELMGKYGINVPKGVAASSVDEVRKAIHDVFPNESEVIVCIQGITVFFYFKKRMTYFWSMWKLRRWMESITLPPTFILFVLEEKKMKLCNLAVFGPNLCVIGIWMINRWKFKIFFHVIFVHLSKRGTLTLILWYSWWSKAKFWQVGEAWEPLKVVLRVEFILLRLIRLKI